MRLQVVYAAASITSNMRRWLTFRISLLTGRKVMGGGEGGRTVPLRGLFTISYRYRFPASRPLKGQLPELAPPATPACRGGWDDGGVAAADAGPPPSPSPPPPHSLHGLPEICSQINMMSRSVSPEVAKCCLKLLTSSMCKNIATDASSCRHCFACRGILLIQSSRLHFGLGYAHLALSEKGAEAVSVCTAASKKRQKMSSRRRWFMFFVI